MMITVPSSRQANVSVSVRIVPRVNGADFLRPSAAAMASGASIGRKRPKSITRPVEMSQCGLYGAGAGLSLKPYVSPRPSKPEPLLAEDEENSYRVSEKPCAAGWLGPLIPR